MAQLSRENSFQLMDSIEFFNTDIQGMLNQLHMISNSEMGRDREGFFLILNAMKDMINNLSSEANGVYVSNDVQRTSGAGALGGPAPADNGDESSQSARRNNVPTPNITKLVYQ